MINFFTKKKRLNDRRRELDALPIGSQITDDNGYEFEKLEDGKWYKIIVAYHYEDDRGSVLDVVGGKKV